VHIKSPFGETYPLSHMQASVLTYNRMSVVDLKILF